MKQTIKIFAVMLLLLLPAAPIFAKTLTYYFANSGPVTVNATYTRLSPFPTQTTQVMTFNTLSTQTINTPPFTFPVSKYTLELTFYRNGNSVTFTPTELDVVGQTIKNFAPDANCAVFLTNDGA